MDIGLGNGMRNKLATLMAHNDIEGSRSLISSTFAMLICIMLPTAIILVGLIIGCDSYHFLNVSRQEITYLDMILITSVILVCSTFIFKLIGNFYMGLQLPAVSNLLIALGQTLSLIATYIICYFFFVLFNPNDPM